VVLRLVGAERVGARTSCGTVQAREARRRCTHLLPRRGCRRGTRNIWKGFEGGDAGIREPRRCEDVVIQTLGKSERGGMCVCLSDSVVRRQLRLGRTSLPQERRVDVDTRMWMHLRGEAVEGRESHLLGLRRSASTFGIVAC
jgi:hypothetical protein